MSAGGRVKLASWETLRLSWVCREAMALAVALILVWHFAVTWMALMPMTVMGVNYGRWSHDFLHNAFFSQSWTLFAPEPPLFNQWFEMRCVFAGKQDGPWLSPYGESSMLRPSGYLDRATDAATGWVFPRFEEKHEKLVRASASGDAALVTRARKLVEAVVRETHALRPRAYEMASHFCRLSDPNRQLEAVGCRILQQPIKPYSQRFDENEPEIVRAELPPRAVDHLHDEPDQKTVDTEVCRYFRHVLEERFAQAKSATRELAQECARLER